MDIKIGTYELKISLHKKFKRKQKTHIDILGRKWKPPMDYFQMVDEICYGAKPDDLCDLCFAPMGDEFKPGQENLCKRCR
jgi:hypothetical protein